MSGLIVPVILAGGQGTRLWPMSRATRPKQFLALMGPTSLYQETLRRVGDTNRYLPAIIVSNCEYRFMVADQAAEIGTELAGVLLEPEARNTAAAIAAAAIFAIDKFGPDAILHVLPSDHSVITDEGYWLSVDRAAQAAAGGSLVTFGIVPTFAETAYGYIKAGQATAEGVFAVEQFIEKPIQVRAQEMLDAGGFLWNSGMFMIGAEAFLAECERLAPDTHAATKVAVKNAASDLDFIRIDPESFARAPNISVDFAIFEKTDRAEVVPVEFAWSDLGSWDAVWKARPKDAGANVSTGAVTLRDASRSLVVSDLAHVVVDGMDDIVVIASADVIYVGRLSAAQNVGAMVKALRNRPETVGLTEIHRTTYRPWGGYTCILDGERFQVQRLFVKPGKKLSLQKHHHRSEHWVVVRGTAEVTIDGKLSMVTENQSVYLPLGATHRLANPGKMLLELIEVQTGSYLGEDDIVRLEDEFGRT